MVKNDEIVNILIWVFSLFIILYFVGQSGILASILHPEKDAILVLEPPCEETDDGMDYIKQGMILSGVNIEDECVNETILIEGYCDTNLTYRLINISCSEEYGIDYTCKDGKCQLEFRRSGGDAAPPSPVAERIRIYGVF